MTNLYLLPILAFAIFQCSCSQSPNHDTKRTSKNTDNLQEKSNFDSLRYIPQRHGWTNDYVQLFSKEETQSLDSLISSYEKTTTVEFSVAIIASSMMGPIDFESYTLLMARVWAVGKKDKKNGIVIVIAPTLRRMRIQNGYGIERVLTNRETKVIIDDIFIPYFKKENFYQGTMEGILAIMKKLQKNGL